MCEVVSGATLLLQLHWLVQHRWWRLVHLCGCGIYGGLVIKRASFLTLLNSEQPDMQVPTGSVSAEDQVSASNMAEARFHWRKGQKGQSDSSLRPRAEPSPPTQLPESSPPHACALGIACPTGCWGTWSEPWVSYSCPWLRSWLSACSRLGADPGSRLGPASPPGVACGIKLKALPGRGDSYCFLTRMPGHFITRGN